MKKHLKSKCLPFSQFSETICHVIQLGTLLLAFTSDKKEENTSNENEHLFTIFYLDAVKRNANQSLSVTATKPFTCCLKES